MTRERVASPFGVRLRQWRRHRGISQLALATEVGSTPRHLSFLETGRSRPSRQMVLRLCDALGVGLRESNQLLHAAGLPANYPHLAFDSPNLAPYQAAIDRMLHAHEPCSTPLRSASSATATGKRHRPDTANAGRLRATICNFRQIAIC